MGTLDLLPSGVWEYYLPQPKARGDEALGSIAGGVLGRRDYSEAPLAPYKSLHAGANGAKTVGSTPWQPPMATLSQTHPNPSQQTWIDAAQVAGQHIPAQHRKNFLTI